MKKITEVVWALAEPAVQAQGCRIWDVEYVREAGQWYLRLYLDKDGGVDILDCEAISRTVSDLLDEADPIQDAYTFEVSSAGADRALKKPEHFAAFLGEQVDAKFYQPVNGQKAVTGTLVGYDNGDVTLDLGDGPVTFAKKDVAQVRLHVGF